MWPEIETAKKENRHELVLNGVTVAERILKDGLDPSMFDLNQLNYLNISDTELKNIPDDLQRLKKLQTLVLHSNKLTSITPKIGHLEQLKMIDISRNCLKEIPEELENCINLVTLIASGNKLEKFPSIKKCTKISLVDLSNNNLKTFPDICREEFSNLAELKLSTNEIESIPSDIYLLPLKTFDINSNKITIIPGELADCSKLKDVNLKNNPIVDRRLFKLIEQCRTKQIIDYVKLHCVKVTTNGTVKGGKKGKKTINERKDSGDISEKEDCDYKYTLKIIHPSADFNVILLNTIKNVREHIIACIVHNIEFNEESFRKFIKLQNNLHDTVCEKRNTATIATHDLTKLLPGNVTYTTLPPKELLITPLNHTTTLSGQELFTKLQTEANNLRKEKKRNTYTGIHKYLYLIEGKSQYPCLLNSNKEVISFPPITNSDISKIELKTTTMFLEVTSSVSQHICKTVMDKLLKEMVFLFGKDLVVEQVRCTDIDGHLKIVYPSRNDLNFQPSNEIKIVRE